MKTARMLATNTLAQMVGKVVTAGTTLLITRLIADQQGLGSDGYNDFSIITVYAAYFYILTDFGLNAIATKEMTEDESSQARYMTNLLSMRVVMSIGLIMLGLAILAFLPYSATVKLGSMLILLTIVTQAIFTNGNALFQTKLRYTQSVIANIVGSITSLSLVFFVYTAGGNLFGYLLAMVTGSAAMAATSLILVGSHIPIRMSFEWPLWRSLFARALPLGITIILSLAYFKADAFILSIVHFDPSLQFSDNKDLYNVGFYNMAFKVFEVALVLPIYIVNVLYPVMVKRAQQGRSELLALFQKAFWGIVGLSLVVAIGMWVAAPLVIDVVSSSNPEFQPSVQVLQWLSLTVPLFFVSNILLWTIMTLGRQKVLVLFYGVAAVVNIGLNIWLIPSYGYMAAIATTALTELITVLLMGAQLWIIFRSKHKDGEGEAELTEIAEVQEAH